MAMRIAAPDSPSFVALHLSEQCQGSCQYCYYAERLSRNLPQPEFSAVRRLLEQLATQSVREILFVGGDPCLHPDLRQILALSKALGFRNGVHSNTLAFRSTEGLAHDLDVAATTVLGETSARHDAEIGVPGAFDALRLNCTLLSQVGVRLEIVINICSVTYSRLFAIAESFARYVPIAHILFQRLIPTNPQAAATVGLSIEQVRVALEQIGAIVEGLGVSVSFEDPFPLCVVPRKHHRLFHPCEWGISKASLLVDGTLARCGASPFKALGNIFVTPLPVLWHQSPETTQFRLGSFMHDECRDCPEAASCAGGCPISCDGRTMGADALLVERLRRGWRRVWEEEP